MDIGDNATLAMLDQTRSTLQRHQEEATAANQKHASLKSVADSLRKELSFHERQLDMCVEHIRKSGIRNIRGSEVHDLRRTAYGGQGNVNKLVDNAITFS